MPVTTQNPRLAGARISASDPAVDGQAFSAATEYDLETVARGVYIATTGDLVVDMHGGIEGRTAATSLTFADVAAGTILALAIKRIDSSTTCTGVVLY